MSGPPTLDPRLSDVDELTFANLQAHDQYPRVCPHWEKEYVSSSNISGLLSNDVHPAFSEDRFIGPGFHHHETLLARRFASRLLEADCIMPFWWAMLFSEIFDSDDTLRIRKARAASIPSFTAAEERAATDQEKREALLNLNQARVEGEIATLEDPEPQEEFEDGVRPPPGPRRLEALDGRKFARTKAMLINLAPSVHFVVGPVGPDGIKCDTKFLQRAIWPFQGSPSEIIIDPRVLREHSFSMEDDLVCRAYASFSLGFKLVQQLAHAVLGASRSGAEINWCNQYRFGVAMFPGSESRMLEAVTFGGVFRKEQEQNGGKSHYTINGHDGVPGLWFAFSDYPSSYLMALVGVPDDIYQDGPYHHREWQVPYSWFLKVLTDTFWDVDVPMQGQTILMPDFEVGYVLIRDEDGKYGPLSAEDVNGGLPPEGYEMIPGTCLMVRKRLKHLAISAIVFQTDFREGIVEDFNEVVQLTIID